MRIQNISALSVVACATVLLSFPLFTHAIVGASTVANPTCVTCVQAAIKAKRDPYTTCKPMVCVDSTYGVVKGHCELTECHADSFSGAGQSGGTGLDQVAKILGDLFGKLMSQPKPPETPPTTPPTNPTNGTGCQGTRFPTHDISLISNPCADYTPPVSTEIPTDTGSCSTLNELLGLCTNNPGNCPSVPVVDCSPGNHPVSGGKDASGCVLQDTCVPEGSTAATFSVAPTSGAVPLLVTATFSLGSSCSPYTLTWGDGTDDNYNGPSGGLSCTQVVVTGITKTHTYNRAGTYTVTFKTGGNGAQTHTVVAANAASDRVIFATTTNFGGLLVPPGGTRGDINVRVDGATIIGGARDTQANVEVAGFYGSETFGTQGSQGLVGTWCKDRPWATNFLSQIVTPTFFDSLCKGIGYQVGAPPAPPAVVLQQTPKPKPKPKPVVATTTAATSTTPGVKPKVDIWAVPASVPLGGRTSVFWNTQGVTNCTETSPNGGFSQNSLSGGAATQPITAATTFSISCLAPDGSPVTNSVTVNLKI